MTQEEKQLLLKDLCARLPYEPKVYWENCNYGDKIKNVVSIDIFDIINDEFSVEECKPYLRPMSSMTEEEQKEFVKFRCVNICPIVITEELTISNEAKMFEWLNKHHFDYRCLIEKGLAIAVTENNNPYKN